MKSLALLVPGPIDQLTGGYLYARRLVDGLRLQGVAITVHELAGLYPEGDAAARRAGSAALESLPDNATAGIDGLALAAFRDCLDKEANRLRILALVHHLLSDETGLSPGEIESLRALEARLLPRCRGILCPSRSTADAVAAYGVARIAIVAPGTMKPAAGWVRPQRPPGSLNLLSVATVTPRKGHDLLVEALASIAARPWRLEIIGSLSRDPGTAATVRHLIERHGLGGRIVLTGEWPQARLAEAYARADIFVLASHHEGYGMAFAEALAWGLPVVATTGGAIPETVPESAGVLMPPGDAVALAAALARLIDDYQLRSRLAAGSAAAGTRLLDWDEAVRQWCEAADRFLQ